MPSKRLFSRKQSRSYGRVFFALLFTFFLSWAGLWYLTSLQFQKTLDSWIAAEKVEKHEISYDKISSGGYPFTVTKRFRNLQWKKGRNTILKTDYAEFSICPWNWKSLKIAFPLGLEVVFATSDLQEKISIKIGEALLHAKTPFLTPKDYTNIGLNISFEIKNSILKTSRPQPFGNKIEKVLVSLHIMGKPPNFYSKESLAAWSQLNGVIEFNAFNIIWGALKLDMKGTLGLNSELQPEGAFSGKIGDRGAVINALAEKKWISKNEASLLNWALDQLPRPEPSNKKVSYNKKTDEIIPLTIQFSAIFLGPVKVVSLPQILWQ